VTTRYPEGGLIYTYIGILIYAYIGILIYAYFQRASGGLFDNAQLVLIFSCN